MIAGEGAWQVPLKISCPMMTSPPSASAGWVVAMASVTYCATWLRRNGATVASHDFMSRHAVACHIMSCQPVACDMMSCHVDVHIKLQLII